MDTNWNARAKALLHASAKIPDQGGLLVYKN
jgi:hypothetical protein